MANQGKGNSSNGLLKICNDLRMLAGEVMCYLGAQNAFAEHFLCLL